MKSLALNQSTIGASFLSLAILLAGCNNNQTIDSRPPLATGAGAVPTAKPSRIRFPVSVSIDTLQQYANVAVPPAVSGSKGLGNFGPAAGNSLSWNLARLPVAVSGGGGRLTVATSIGGSVTVRGSIQPIRGDIGKLLGKLKPSQPYSQTADVGADILASIAPQLQADWSVVPHLAGQAIVREASARIAGIFDLSFRGELQGPVNDAVNRTVADLNARIAADRTLKGKALEAWTKLCEPVPVPVGNGLPDLSLRVSPRGFVATQPVIDASSVRLDLGLDAVVRLVPATTPAEACPPFNETMTIAASTDGVTSVALSADFGYDALNQALEAVRSKQPKVSGSGVEAEFSKIALAPLGDLLLLEVDGRFTETSFFGASATGTIYLAARPELDVAGQRLGFSNVSIDAASRDALGRVAVALGSTLSPLIESRLKEMTIDLRPVIEKARDSAAAAAAKLKDAKGPVRVSEAALDDQSLASLWHDAAGVHVAIEANGRIALEAIDIKP